MQTLAMKREQKQRQPLYVTLGTMLLFGVFIAMLAGRFSLDRLNPSLPAMDLRLVFVYLLTTAGIVWYYGARKYLPPRTKSGAVGMVFLWIAWLGLTVAWSPLNARIGDYMMDLFALAFLLGLGFLLLGILPTSATERIWTWLFVAGILYFFAALAVGPDHQGRIAAPGGGPNVFVRVMILAAIAAFYLSVQRGKRLPLFFVPLFALGSALSGSRGGLVAAGIVMVLAAIPIARRLGAGKVVALLILGGAATTVAVATDSRIVSFIQDRFIQQTIVERYSSSRNTITDQATELFRENPFFGSGLDGYYASQTGTILYEYPHNLVLASAAEGGMVGVAVLLIALLVLFRAAIKQRPLPPAVFFSLLAGMFVFFAGLFSGDYYDSRFMWFFLGMAAIEGARPRIVPETTAENRVSSSVVRAL